MQDELAKFTNPKSEELWWNRYELRSEHNWHQSRLQCLPNASAAVASSGSCERWTRV